MPQNQRHAVNVAAPDQLHLARELDPSPAANLRIQAQRVQFGKACPCPWHREHQKSCRQEGLAEARGLAWLGCSSLLSCY